MTLTPHLDLVPPPVLPGRPVVLGGGPAGLTAALVLARRGLEPLVLEAGDRVGGIARTEVRDGYRFDLGGHRFFTKSEEVSALWRELLGDEFLRRPRLSRIYWNGRFLDYPLRAGNVVCRLGPVELTRCMASYARAAMRRRGPEETFEQWVSNRFGRRLFELFFRSYTEKVWGVPTDEIRAEWAAQRIQNLSFLTAAKAALTGGGSDVKSLIDAFDYPRLGPGQMWEAMADEIVALGGEVRLGARADRIDVEDGRVVAVGVGDDEIACGPVVSSLPLREIVAITSPAAPDDVRDAAAGLRYRDFLTVALVVDGADPFPDNWIYVHEPDVRVGRIQNYRAWSPDMVPDPATACVGLEYFCFEGDDLWTMSDEGLVALATDEVDRLGLVDRASVTAGHVVRVPKAYPIYDAEYAARVDRIRGWLGGLPGLEQVGRNGLHRYNNCDHSMLTAMYAVENLLEGAGHDVWAVNTDSAYHEEQRPEEQPYRVAPTTPAMAEPLPERT